MDGAKTLRDYLAANPPGPFVPGPRLSLASDGLECWVSDARAVSESISPHLTLRRCMQTGKVVGVTVWGVRHLFAGGEA